MRASGELGEAKSRSWGAIHLHPTHFLPVGAQDARRLTFGVPRGQGHEGAGSSEAGATEKQGKGSGCFPPRAAQPTLQPPAAPSSSPTAQPPHLPISRVGRGPKRSMRTPSGRVVALSTKEPMVKPRLSISSCWLQLGHPCSSSWVVLVVFSAEEGRGEAARDCERSIPGARAGLRGPALQCPGLCLPADRGTLESCPL